MSWKTGTLIGNRYELRMQLCSGGMADVWIARDITKDESDFEAPVVLKCLHRDLQVTGLLFEEFRHVITLHHPNIITVFDVGEHEGLHYIVMEYLRGKDLSGVITRVAERTAMGVHEHYVAYCAWIIARVCQALHCAHDNNDAQGNPKDRVIHRDISPQNIMLQIDGSVKLIDFGIARALEKFAHITRSPIWGKTMYMPPEQWLNKGVNEQSDIFALGVVMSDLITGDNLFYSRKTATERPRDLEKAITRKPSESARFPISLDTQELAKKLDPIVLKALAIRPEDRHPTAKAMGDEIQKALRQTGFDWVSQQDLGDFMRGLFTEELNDPRGWPEGLRAGFFRTAPEVVQVLAPREPKPPLPPAWMLILVTCVVLLSWVGMVLAAHRPLQLAPLPKAMVAVAKPTPAPAVAPLKEPSSVAKVPSSSRTARKRTGSRLSPHVLAARARGKKGKEGVPLAVPRGAEVEPGRDSDAGPSPRGTCPLKPEILAEVQGITSALIQRRFATLRPKAKPSSPLVAAGIPADLAKLKTILDRKIKAIIVVCAAASQYNDYEAVQAELQNFPALMSTLSNKNTLQEDPLKWCNAQRKSALARIAKILASCSE